MMKQPLRTLFRSDRVPNSARLIAPILLGAALIGIAISTMRFGGKRESLGAYAEASLLRFALKHAAEPAKDNSRIVTISVKDTDLPTLRSAPHQVIRDAHIEEYASIVERVARHNPRFIVVSWLSSAHPLSAQYLRPLTDTIDRLGIADKTILAVHLYTTGAVPEELARKYIIAEARDCYYEVNSFCTLNPAWTWMPQQIAKEFWRDRRPWTVSQNLPHTLPNFVLNLPTPASMTQLSFLDFRPPVTAEIGEDVSVFIGNDTSQELHFRDNKDLLQKTFIPVSPSHRSLMSDGIPFHLFWASMAQMFIDDNTVAVAPEWLCNLALIFMCLAVLYSIQRLRGLALGPFLICAISLPVANLIGIKFAHVYMPVVPIITSGFAIFTAAAFISVAMNSYRKWRLEARERNAESTTDIKENFISLISHNLNTPIAQLRGLLDMLLAEGGPSKVHLSKALIHLEFMRVAVRAVLNSSSLNTYLSLPQNYSLKKIWQQFEDTDGILVSRLGIQLDLFPHQDDEVGGEVWYYKFSFDLQALTATLLYAIVLVRVRHKASSIKIEFAPLNFEPANAKGLMVRLTWSPESNEAVPLDISASFIENAINRYLEATYTVHGTTVIYGANSIALTFPDAAFQDIVFQN